MGNNAVPVADIIHSFVLQPFMTLGTVCAKDADPEQTGEWCFVDVVL